MAVGFIDTTKRDTQTESRPNWIDLQQLVSRCMGSLALADQLILKFLSGLEDKIRDLRTAAREQDIEEIRRISHRLKGEALTLGAQSIAELAATTETGAREGIAILALQSAEELAELCETTRHEAFTFGGLRN